MKAAAPRQLISHISEPSHCQLAGSFLTDSINILFCNLYGAIQPRFPPALCHPLLHLILNLILQRERERESFAVCSAKSKGFCNPQLGTAPTQRLKGILEAAHPPLPPSQGSPFTPGHNGRPDFPPPPCYFPQGQHSAMEGQRSAPLFVRLRGCRAPRLQREAGCSQISEVLPSH